MMFYECHDMVQWTNIQRGKGIGEAPRRSKMRRKPVDEAPKLSDDDKTDSFKAQFHSRCGILTEQSMYCQCLQKEGFQVSDVVVDVMNACKMPFKMIGFAVKMHQSAAFTCFYKAT